MVLDYLQTPLSLMERGPGRSSALGSEGAGLADAGGPRPPGGSSQIGQGGLNQEEKCKDFDTSSGVWGAGCGAAQGFGVQDKA